MSKLRSVITREGEVVIVGKYTEAIRAHYIAYRKGRYLVDHPGATIAEAARAARLAWRRKLIGSES